MGTEAGEVCKPNCHEVSTGSTTRRTTSHQRRRSAEATCRCLAQLPFLDSVQLDLYDSNVRLACASPHLYRLGVACLRCLAISRTRIHHHRGARIAKVFQ